MTPKTHVLLADDERDFRFAASVALRGAGYRVTVARNGHEALACVVDARGTDHPVGILVTDQRMPGMMGTELVAALRARGFAIPAIIITACRDASTTAGLQLGMVTELIDKPIAPEALVSCLQRVMRVPAERSA